jgi:hypothetical protein
VYEAIPCEEFVPAYFVLRARKLEGCYPIITLSGSWNNYLLYDDLKYSFNLIGFILESHEKIPDANSLGCPKLFVMVYK